MPRVSLAAFAAVVVVGMLGGWVLAAVFAGGVILGRLFAVLAVLERQHRAREHAVFYRPPGEPPSNVRRIR